MEKPQTNPYDSPPPNAPSGKLHAPRFLTRQRVTWMGMGLIIAAVIAFTGSHSLFVQSKQMEREWDTVVRVIDIFAMFAIAVGIIALMALPWLPSTRISFKRVRSSNEIEHSEN